MESSIAFSIGIGLNRSLRSRLRALAGASESQPIFVRHVQTCAWIEIDPKGSVAARRQKPEGLPSTKSLGALRIQSVLFRLSAQG
jgi:hypothetical protein